MAVLTDCATEIFEFIFKLLGSLDDVHHLARTCRKVHEVIGPHTIYFDIMRTVVLNAPHHRFDIQLCRMLDHHAAVANHYRATPTDAIVPGSLAYPPSMVWAVISNSQLGGDSQPKTILSDEHLCDILARYQGLRLLQKLWLCDGLEQNDYLPVNYGVWNYLANAWERLLDRRQQRTAYTQYRNQRDCKSFEPYHRERFHAAVTHLWLLNELRWNLCAYLFPSIPPAPFAWALRDLDTCKAQLASQVETPLLDQLDLYAMYKFLYHHLLPVHAIVLGDGVASRLPLTFCPMEVNQNSPRSGDLLRTCLKAAQVFLQPADIIDLVVRHESRSNLSDSTMAYIMPYHPFGRAGLAHIALPAGFSTRMQVNYEAFMDRGSFAQSQRHPVNIFAPYTPLNDPGDDKGWFKDQVLDAFHKNFRSDLQDIERNFDYYWNRDVNWKIWWWANSEDKARAKMERWRRYSKEFVNTSD